MDTLNFPNVALLAFPVVIIFILLEVIVSKAQGRPVYTPGDSGVSVFMLVLGQLVLPVSFFPIMKWLYEYRFFDFGYEIWAFFVLFILQDFFYYWYHRFSHRCRIAWASHVVHHSSPNLNIMTSWRLESFGGPAASWIYWAPTAILGFPPEMFLFIYSIKIVYANLCHTQMIGKLPRWYEFIFNTPSHHRVHHGSNPEYIDKNYGSTLIIWDRMFGTFTEENLEKPVIYGVTKPLNTNNVLIVLFHEWISIFKDVWSSTHWTAAMKKIFYYPGWEDNYRKQVIDDD